MFISRGLPKEVIMDQVVAYKSKCKNQKHLYSLIKKGPKREIERTIVLTKAMQMKNFRGTLAEEVRGERLYTEDLKQVKKYKIQTKRKILHAHRLKE